MNVFLVSSFPTNAVPCPLQQSPTLLPATFHKGGLSNDMSSGRLRTVDSISLKLRGEPKEGCSYGCVPLQTGKDGTCGHRGPSNHLLHL